MSFEIFQAEKAIKRAFAKGRDGLTRDALEFAITDVDTAAFEEALRGMLKAGTICQENGLFYLGARPPKVEPAPTPPAPVSKPAPAAAESKQKRQRGELQALVLRDLQAAKGSVSPKDVASRCGCSADHASLVLGHLVKSGKAVKLGRGLFANVDLGDRILGDTMKDAPRPQCRSMVTPVEKKRKNVAAATKADAVEEQLRRQAQVAADAIDEYVQRVCGGPIYELLKSNLELSRATLDEYLAQRVCR